MAEIFNSIVVTIKDIAQDIISENGLNSTNWGIWHSIANKFVKSTTRKTNNIPITTLQIITESFGYIPWPGLKIKRTTVPNKFREQAYQFLKKHFENKYGQYPVQIEHHWNTSSPLYIQWSTPENTENPDQSAILYHIRGGSWVFRHNFFDNHILTDLTEASSSQVLSIMHRLFPQYPLLCQIEDVLSGYLYLIAPKPEGGASRSNTKILVGGYSSGGHLAASLLHILRNLSIPPPAGAYLISPALDLTFSQPSFYENTKRDILWDVQLPSRLDSEGLHIYSGFSKLIYGKSPSYAVKRVVKDGSPFGPKEILLWSEISPLLDPNMDSLPPTIVIVGERDSLRDDSILYGKLRAEAEIRSKIKKTIIPNIQTYNYDDMVHAFPVLPSNKYCKKAVKAMGEFIYQALNANN